MLKSPSARRIGLLLLEDQGSKATDSMRRLGLALATSSFSFLCLVLVLAFHAFQPAGYLASPLVVQMEAESDPIEDGRMTRSKDAMVLAGIASLWLTAPAVAQAEWRVSNGGNGHWYSAVVCATGDAAQALAQSRGAQLASIGSAAENDFVTALLNATDREWGWIGLRQSAGEATPTTGWYWTDGQPLKFENWTDHGGQLPSGAPDDSPCALPPWGVENDQANQGALMRNGEWDDLDAGQPTCGAPTWSAVALLEWSADCNLDGVVDYGQIQSGAFEDNDADGIPDCCESGIPCGQNLLQNGSFEEGPTQPCHWICIEQGDSDLPGWSVTLNSVDRQWTEPPLCEPESWIAADGRYSIDLNGCSVGGAIEQSVVTVAGRRYAISVQLTVNAGWNRGDLRIHAGPNAFDFTAFRTNSAIQPWSWKVVEFTATSSLTPIRFESLNREYPAQWAGPVIDDARVVLLPSPSCPGDVTGNLVIDGVDLAAILGAWGSDGTGQFDTDINDDGAVNGIDLAEVLGGWGPCE